MNAGLIANGIGIGWVPHKLKSGKQFSSKIITAPFCNVVKGSSNVVNSRN